MPEIQCQYRRIQEDRTPLCEVVANLTKLPLVLCHTNDSACEFCLKCGVAPQTPNRATASMSVHAATRNGEDRQGATYQRMRQILIDRNPPATAANTPCILRGPQIRTQDCPPCQAGSKIPVQVPVYRCQTHGECTIRNTGTHPKIQGCVTCEQRQSTYPRLHTLPTPPEVLAAILSGGRSSH